MWMAVAAPEPKTLDKLKIRTSYTQHTNTHHSQIHKERERSAAGSVQQLDELSSIVK